MDNESKIKTTIWLSTDGKHTVQVETTDTTQGMEALAIAEEIYTNIEEKHGRKVDQWKELNDKDKPGWLKDGTVKESANDNPNAPVCQVHRIKMTWRKGGISKSTGRPYPGFWACPEKDENGQFCNYKPPRE